MLHELTITVDDDLYKKLKPMVDQQTIGSFLKEFVQNRIKERTIPVISTLRGTLHHVNTSDVRDETERSL